MKRLTAIPEWRWCPACDVCVNLLDTVDARGISHCEQCGTLGYELVPLYVDQVACRYGHLGGAA